MEVAIVDDKEEKSFKDCVREHLQAGADITRLEAYKLSGLPIKGDMEEYGGKRYKRYYVEQDQ